MFLLRALVNETKMCYTYDSLIRTGTNKVIFAYNGRDGVVTDDNGLVYMRARYYSPAMKRFINADVIAGAISNAITLNRFAYANGNPVSFVDPFGLSAERGATISADGSATIITENEHKSKILQNANYTLAILVSTRDRDGLFIVGHTKLYLYDETNQAWFLTQYSGDVKEVIRDKNKATVEWYQCVAPSLNGLETNEKKDYIVLTGDFNDSAYWADQIYGSSLGGYNLLYNNCSDYTNDVLALASIDNKSLDKYFEDNADDGEHISIPRSDVTKAQEIAGGGNATNNALDADTIVNSVVQFFKNVWDAITFWD